MSAPMEVLLSTEVTGQLWNTAVWDLFSGSSLATFKGGSSKAHTLAVAGSDYLISAVCNKPIIHTWPLLRQEQNHQTFVAPGQVTALAVSPDGFYCVAAVSEKIHVWQTSTGNLMAVLGRHYQTVTIIRFTDDGTHFLSGGDDNLVIVWPLNRVLSSSCESSIPGSSVDLRYVWSQHSLPITGIHVGRGGCRARVATASLDQTVKVWEMSSGRLLLDLVFDQSVTSVTMDAAEQRLFVGCVNGSILATTLHERPIQVQKHISNSSENSPTFEGHTKAVKCMCVSMDGTILVSGSDDTSVKLWHVASGQCTRTIKHKGSITNLLLISPPPWLLSSEKHSLMPLRPFKRYLHNSQQAQDNSTPDGSVQCVQLRLKSQPMDSFDDEEDELILPNIGMEDEGDSNEERVAKLQQHVKQLQAANKQLYMYAAKEILDRDIS